ncbi:unnamed protein product, partial [Tetraodon nigroviridis]
RRVPDHVSLSRISYFKRKFVDEDEPPLSFRTYCQTVSHDTLLHSAPAPATIGNQEKPERTPPVLCRQVAPFLEERAHVLRLSLEKMRFIDDPEAFLRRSVLVNNLLRRLRAEILLQSSDWCFP